MPVIKVWCLPHDLTEEQLREIHKGIVKAVENVEILGIKGEQGMVTLFPKDMMSYGLGSEIVIEVSGLFEKIERTDAVRNELACNLGAAVQGVFPDAFVMCLIDSFNHEKGFWSSREYV